MWCWSIGGHLKLQMFVTEIYVAIDTYSCYVTCFYYRVSGRWVSVVLINRFIQNRLLLHIRADRGRETILLAGTFWELHEDHNLNITFPEVFWYGTLTRNVHIESW
ncbi:hypothetical protein P167DRAFT_497905 [Morchella conica CCBAS932]|uniref:Uncharacterized protein n=1 Tax=Morchella conica CCBAS932 TaxID=1392247 RepID=A0A3N4KCZ9_9PEZI|nr:hypothetical protein P167DRAFT_497905 [Morchella conica CCBAS932]